MTSPSDSARHAADSVSAHRRRKREEGLRPVQLWLPDVRSPEFLARCQAEAAAITARDPEGEAIQRWIDGAFEWPDYDWGDETRNER